MPCPPSRHLSRRQLLLATAAACLLGPSGTASAQGATPLKLVITFPPGGSTDIAARILQPRLGEVAGRPVIVENRRSEEHTSELQSPCNLVCRLLLEKKKKNKHLRLKRSSHS